MTRVFLDLSFSIYFWSTVFIFISLEFFAIRLMCVLYNNWVFSKVCVNFDFKILILLSQYLHNPLQKINSKFQKHIQIKPFTLTEITVKCAYGRHLSIWALPRLQIVSSTFLLDNDFTICLKNYCYFSEVRSAQFRNLKTGSFSLEEEVFKNKR
jgi:hypothetical protein